MFNFFSLLMWIPGENRAKLKKLFNSKSRLRWGAQYSRYVEYTIIFLSEIAVMQVTFWTEDNFCLISDCRNSFNCKLKRLINEKIIIFYSLSNALCSSDESIQLKYFNHHPFWYAFPFHLVQSANSEYWNTENTEILLTKTHRILNRLSKFAKVRYHKNHVFL